MLIKEGEKVLCKEKNLSLVESDLGLCITDGYLTDWIIVYNKGSWAHDGVFNLNDYELIKHTINLLDK